MPEILGALISCKIHGLSRSVQSCMLDKNTTANILLPMQHNADGCSYNVIHPFSMMKYTTNISEMKADKG